MLVLGVLFSGVGPGVGPGVVEAEDNCSECSECSEDVQSIRFG